MLDSVVIVGAGQGGFQTAASLRQDGFSGRIVLIGDEPGLPYQRPPLSKAYMSGKAEVAELEFRPAAFYAEQKIEILHDTAVSIDRRQKQVGLKSGGTISYGHLVLSTGAVNRPLTVPGADFDGVFVLRTLSDADQLKQRLGSTRNVVVVGAGFIGLEFAAVARAAGIDVQIVEMAERPMGRAVTPAMSAFYVTAHEAWGAHFHFGRGLRRIAGQNRHVTGVELDDGRSLPADMVIVGIGVLPNVAIAEAAGLEIRNGIVVNSALLTSDPHISAIGDCAQFPCSYADTPIRLESVQNAADQARNVAAGLMGKPAPYTALPWFWSDQGDLKLQTVGLPTGYDATVILGNQESRSFSVLLFRAGRLIAVESVNRPADFMMARKILARTTKPLMLETAQAAGFDLRSWEMANR